MNDTLSYVISHGTQILGALTALLTAAIAVATLFPGDEPEATLQKIVDFMQKIVDFISKISRK
jgi:hypothetical protein